MKIINYYFKHCSFTVMSHMLDCVSRSILEFTGSYFCRIPKIIFEKAQTFGFKTCSSLQVWNPKNEPHFCCFRHFYITNYSTKKKTFSRMLNVDRKVKASKKYIFYVSCYLIIFFISGFHYQFLYLSFFITFRFYYHAQNV